MTEIDAASKKNKREAKQRGYKSNFLRHSFRLDWSFSRVHVWGVVSEG